MNRALLLSLVLVGYLQINQALCEESVTSDARYKALACPQPSHESTWAILSRDGANRDVGPYLSSLGQGEGGIGVISSPPFVIRTDTITFTIRGHDGQGGGKNQNHIVLVDARKGKELRRTPAPGNDALQDSSWDVGDLKNTEVRIEVHDGDRAGAFAWLGVGRINAGPEMTIDFSKGMPKAWKRSQREATVRYELVTGGVPFRRNAAVHSIIPNSGSVEIPCNFEGKRVFLLGCTVGLGQPGKTYGGVELHYQSGKVDIIQLMVGYTLDSEGKMPIVASHKRIRRSGDPFQYYLPIALREEPLKTLRLVSNPDRGPIPRITAITVETNSSGNNLTDLPAPELRAIDQEWIKAASVSAGTLAFSQIPHYIRMAHRLPMPPDPKVQFRKVYVESGAFRSEGVAVADFTGDGKLDIATGNQNYVGPLWFRLPLFDQPREFPLKGYSDSFLCFDGDVNEDGAIDVVVVGFPGRETHWLENPGKSGPWKKHLAVEKTGNESPDYVDVDDDGRRELLFMSGNRCAVARPSSDASEPWNIQFIAGPNDPGAVHGLGTGDINGDGITDIVSPNGWWQGPGKATDQPWEFHAASIFGGAQLCVADFDGDGDNDVLGSSAHAYGIAWTEQTDTGWVQHTIDDTDSQTHAIHLADIDRDGLVDFVTGKRFWAHNGRDPGSYERSVLCWYRLSVNDGIPTWTKYEIDGDTGVGLHFRIVDINGDGRLDIVTSNKKGVYLFEQR